MRLLIALKLLLTVTATWAQAAALYGQYGEQLAPDDLQQPLNGDRPGRLKDTTALDGLVNDLDASKGLRSVDDTQSIAGSLLRTETDKEQTWHTRYTDQLVLRFNVSSSAEASNVISASDALFLDTWDVSQHHVDIRLNQGSIPPLLELLPSALRDSYTTRLDSTTLSDAIAGTLTAPTSLDTTETSAFFRDYRPLSVFTSWFTLLTALFPSISRLATVGHTAEGRPIQGLFICTPQYDSDEDDQPRKTLLLTAGSHAREWVSTSSAAFVAHSLLTGYGLDSDITSLLSSLDVLIVPTLNPDGYVYTWEHDRLWRKTRQSSVVPFCNGIDLDRNYGFAWDSGSASSNPCSGNYAGAEPFSAVEAKTFAGWLRNETDAGKMQVVGMLDLHSYSQQVLLPFAYSCVSEPANEEDLEETGQGIARAIKRTYGKWYEVLRACEGDVPMRTAMGNGGSPMDWFYNELGVRYTYQIKLRDTGSYGFLLPPEHIVPAGREVTNAVLFLGRALIGEDSVVGDGEL